MPLFSTHQNLVIKNRPKIVLNIVHLAQDLLSPEAIKKHLENLSPSETLLKHFSEPQNQEQALNLIRNTLSTLTERLEDPKLAAFLEELVRAKVEKADVAKPIGVWMGKCIDRGDHEQLWESLLETINKTLQSTEAKHEVGQLVKRAVGDWVDEKFSGLLKTIVTTGVNTAEMAGFINYALVADFITKRANNFVATAKSNPNNAIRMNVNDNLRKFARDLETGVPSAVAILKPIQDNLANHLELNGLIKDLLKGFKSTIDIQLNDNSSRFMIYLKEFLASLLNDLRANPSKRTVFDETLRNWILKAIETNHNHIGQIITESFNKLDDKDFVDLIEEKVGNDLQWIRLNGTIMGFLVGCLIGGINYYLTAQF